MNKTLGVKIVYRNEALKPVSEKVYLLREYTDMLRAELLRLIADIEDMAYQANDNKQKSEWSDESWAAFCKIKHKLLDKAGDVGRLPDNLVECEER